MMNRWNWIFKSISAEAGPRWLFNVSGNHDIGWNIPPLRQVDLVYAYEQHFGELNYMVRVGNYSFIGSSPTGLSTSFLF